MSDESFTSPKRAMEVGIELAIGAAPVVIAGESADSHLPDEGRLMPPRHIEVVSAKEFASEFPGATVIRPDGSTIVADNWTPVGCPHCGKPHLELKHTEADRTAMAGFDRRWHKEVWKCFNCDGIAFRKFKWEPPTVQPAATIPQRSAPRRR